MHIVAKHQKGLVLWLAEMKEHEEEEEEEEEDEEEAEGGVGCGVWGGGE
jgi:hypothetical protein